MQEEYEGIARRALENAEAAMRISRGDTSITDRYRNQALAYVEIATAASTLLAALNTPMQDLSKHPDNITCPDCAQVYHSGHIDCSCWQSHPDPDDGPCGREAPKKEVVA